MKIIELRAKNVMRLSAVTIRPDGSLVVVGGKNAAGKTSVLNAIAFALGGKRLVVEKPLRAGQKKGYTKVDLGEFVVTRTFTSTGGGTLKIESADGKAFATPQKMLDEMVGRLSFDPLEFARMSPPDQLATLKQVVGLDFAQLDAKREDLYDKRRTLKRDLAADQQRLRDLPSYPDAPQEEISIQKLSEELSAADEYDSKTREIASTLAEARHERERTQAEIHRLLEAIEEIEAKFCRLKSSLSEAQEKMAEIDTTIKDMAKSLERREEQSPDRHVISQAMVDAQEMNKQIHANEARRKQRDYVAKLEDDVEALTGLIEIIDQQKREMVAEAEFPVEGLGFGEAGITFFDVPFEQASSAEQLQVSVGMGLAMNPKLKVLLIRDGSLLDADHLMLLGKMAEEADAQVWIERVGQDEKTSVVIEDGVVKEEQ